MGPKIKGNVLEQLLPFDGTLRLWRQVVETNMNRGLFQTKRLSSRPIIFISNLAPCGSSKEIFSAEKLQQVFYENEQGGESPAMGRKYQSDNFFFRDAGKRIEAGTGRNFPNL